MKFTVTAYAKPFEDSQTSRRRIVRSDTFAAPSIYQARAEFTRLNGLSFREATKTEPMRNADIFIEAVPA